jgi:hypothetical protein
MQTTTAVDLIRLEDVEREIVSVKKKIDNLLNLAEQMGIDATTFKSRLSERQTELTALEEERDKINAEYGIYKQKDKLLTVTTNAIKAFKKQKTFEDKRNFLRNIVKSIVIGWDTIESVYGISIFFKLNEFENYLISKQVVVDRTLKNGKAQSKVLSETVSLQRSVYLDDEKDESIFAVPYVNLGEPNPFFKFKKG